MKQFQLADLVTPLSVEEFINTTYAQSWKYFEGEPSRFADLANWETLNTLLATQDFDSPRLRLAQRGKTISKSEYIDDIQTRQNHSYTKVSPRKLLEELRNGATLAIDGLEHAHEPLRDLACALESTFKARVFIGIFASWVPIAGFDVHWDDYDVFVLQIAGTKHWQIFEPTRRWPLQPDINESPRPATPPVAEFDITPGDVLYVPHGWWHSVSALGEASLHLAIGVSPNNGLDFMSWLVDRARSSELFRKRIPRFGTAFEKKQYLAAIQDTWRELLESDNILDQYLTFADGSSRSMPLFALPNILDENTILNNKDATISLLASRATISTSGDNFILTALGRRWSFPAVAKPLIESLLSQEKTNVRQAITSASDITEDRAANVLFTLLKAGVIALR